MRSRRRSFWKNLNELTDLIELLIDCHPQGFGVLLGEVPPPSPKEIHAMMDARRSHEPAGVRPASLNLTTEAERIVWDAEKFDEVIKAAGGWFHITKISQEYKEAESRLWAVVTDHVRYVGKSTTRHVSRLGYVATRYGLSPNTVMKYRREFAQKLAEVILLPPADCDDFYLLPG